MERNCHGPPRRLLRGSTPPRGWQPRGCIRHVLLRSNAGSVVRISRSVLGLVLVVVLLIDLSARVFDYDYGDDDQGGRILVNAARDLGGIG